MLPCNTAFQGSSPSDLAEPIMISPRWCKTIVTCSLSSRRKDQIPCRSKGFIDPLIRDEFVKEEFSIDTFAASLNDVELPWLSRA